MLKAKLNNGDLIFGLSEENIQRIKDNQPIKISLKDLGLEDRNILIFYGETEEKMYKTLMPYIDIERTEIHDDDLTRKAND